MSTDRTMRDRLDAAIGKDEVLDLARRLVSIPSYGPEHGWEAGGRVLEEFLTREGLAVTRQRVAEGRDNVLAVLPGARPGRPLLMFNGHMDTVPPSASMRYRPFAAEVHEGRLWGRGAVDMKGSVAAMAVAFAALRRTGLRPPRPLILAAVVGEEAGGAGTSALGTGGVPADLAVVGEPSDFSISFPLARLGAEDGSGVYEIDCKHGYAGG